MSTTAQVPNRDPGPASGHGAFATTHWSLVLEAGESMESNAARDALEALCRSYWTPIHSYIRRRGNDSEAARDLTQGFFAMLLSRGSIASANPDKGRFRTFLLTAVQRFLADDHDRRTASKRGGGELLLSLDELAAEEGRPFEPAAARSAESEFDRRWALATLDNALRHLRAEAERSGQGELFAALQGHLANGETPAPLLEVGARFGLGESAVKMRLHRWRARYRELIREEVRQTVPRMADLDEEMRHLLAAIVG